MNGRDVVAYVSALACLGMSACTCSGPSLNIDNEPPNVDILSPADWAAYGENAEIDVIATVGDYEDDDISKMDYTWTSSEAGELNGQLVVNDGEVTYIIPGLKQGTHEITVSVKDSGDLTAKDSVNIQVLPNDDPEVDLLTPLNGFYYPENEPLHVTAQVSDNNEENIEDIQLSWSGSATTSGDEAWPDEHPDEDGDVDFYLTGLPGGSYDLLVTAEDTLHGTDDVFISFDLVPLDEDGDGFTNPKLGGDDCDDTNPDVYPGAEELCNLIDDNCDGVIDEVAPTFYHDTDGDEHGDPNDSVVGCDRPDDYVLTNDDCDDNDGDVYPGHDELCNGKDDDCDTFIDEDDAVDVLTWYQDADDDNFGDPDVTDIDCYQPDGFVADYTDCDDARDLTYPGADEYCNTIDDDCDTEIDEDDAVDAKNWYVDDDGDDYGDPDTEEIDCYAPSGKHILDGTDCVDTNMSIHPGAPEYCNGVDDDCDEVADDDPVDGTWWYADVDKDTHGGTGLRYCSKPSGYISTSDDCDDDDSGIYPGAPEHCDGFDEDCDDVIDNDPVDPDTFYRDADEDTWGTDSDTVDDCSAPEGYVDRGGDCDDTDPDKNPLSVWYYDADGDGYGDASEMVSSCDSPGSGYVPDPGECPGGEDDPTVHPGAAEVCFSGEDYEGKDNDCDGSSDEDCPLLHCGIIDKDETWDDRPEGHYIACDTFVQGSTTPLLTIEPGATIYFAPGVGLYIGNGNFGDISVEGTSSKSVVFTSYMEAPDSLTEPEVGDWTGLSLGMYSNASDLSYLTVRYAEQGLYTSDATGATIDHSTFRDSQYDGIAVYGGNTIVFDHVTSEYNESDGLSVSDSQVTARYSVFQENGGRGVNCTDGQCISTAAGSFPGNTLTKNSAGPMYIDDVSVVPNLDSTSTYVGNDSNDTIEVYGGTISTTSRWKPMDVPYRIVGDHLCYLSTLTLSDGVTIYMTKGWNFTNTCGTATAYGNLVVEGSTTGVRIASGATSPAPSDYQVILTEITSATQITGLTVEYADHGLAIVSKAAIALHDLTVKHAGKSGIFFNSIADGVATGTLTVDGCLISDTKSYGITFSNGSALTVQDCTIENATGWGLIPSTSNTSPMTLSVENTAINNTLKYGVTGGEAVHVKAKTVVVIGTWSGNTFSGNAGFPVVLESAEHMYALDGLGSSYDGNATGYDYVQMSATSLTTSGTIPALDVPYYWSGGTVSINASSVIVDGADIRVKSGAYGVKIGSSAATAFTANGASFLPYKSSGTYTSSDKGTWQGLWFDTNSAGSILDSTEVGYGGKGYSANGYPSVAADVWLYASGITVRNSSNVHDSLVYGIKCPTTGCPGHTITDVVYSGNQYNMN